MPKHIDYKKGVYTLDEIADFIIKTNPGRFKNHASAYASVKTTARELGVGDINGKKRCKLIAARDVERIVSRLDGMRRKSPGKPKANKPKRAEQVTLFDEGVLDWLEPYTPDVSKDPEPIVTDEPMTARDLAAKVDRCLAELGELITAYFNAVKEEANNG